MDKIDGGYFFDGPGDDDDALIFSPGAKVETLAYASLMASLADHGIDCFLADMPFRIAVFGSDTADKFIGAYEYKSRNAAGHSLGGFVISDFAEGHADQLDNLILLAAYPGKKIPDGISLSSIYGTRDGCLNRAAYEEAKAFWPEDSSESQLEGGNHAQFADYGPQSGDLEAEISPEEKQNKTVEIILEAIDMFY